MHADRRKRPSTSRREVARASGLSAGAIHSLEHARTSPRISTLERLAEGLDVELRELIEGRQGNE